MRARVLAAGSVLAAGVVALGAIAACGGSDSSTSPAQSQNPQIAGCNSVSYKGTTFSNIGCAPGIASFDITISQNGVTGKFHVACTNGCVSAVTLI